MYDQDVYELKALEKVVLQMCILGIASSGYLRQMANIALIVTNTTEAPVIRPQKPRKLVKKVEDNQLPMLMKFNFGFGRTFCLTRIGNL